MVMTPPPGTLLEGDRYRIIAPLGSGGMGDVLEGFDERLHRPVAIKLVDTTDPTAARRLRAEAQALARLRHPHIVTVFDSGEHEGRPYVVTELVHGRTLRQALLDDGALEPEVVARLGVELADALACAHENGIVHRDVTPGNVLLGDDGSARLIDFGIATTERGSDLTATGMVIGTPAYLSPEQVEGRRAGSASDVYALGLVLAEAVSGTRVFTGTIGEATMARLAADAPLPPMAPAWRATLEPLVRRQPHDRPSMTTVSRSLAALGTGADTTSVMAASTTPMPAADRAAAAAGAAAASAAVPVAPAGPRRRRPAQIGLAAAVTVVAVALVLLVAARGGDSPSGGSGTTDVGPTTTVALTASGAAPTTAAPTTVAPTTAPTTTAPPAPDEKGKGPDDQGKGKGRGNQDESG